MTKADALSQRLAPDYLPKQNDSDPAYARVFEFFFNQSHKRNASLYSGHDYLLCNTLPFITPGYKDAPNIFEHIWAQRHADQECFDNRPSLEYVLPAYVQVSRKNIIALHTFLQLVQNPVPLILELHLVCMSLETLRCRFTQTFGEHDPITEEVSDRLFKLQLTIWLLWQMTETP